MQNFKDKIWDFYGKNKRIFPWRSIDNTYYVLVSEIMLQQTQVARVIPKYELFIQELPTIRDLAFTPLPKLLSLWQGLGYNRRALYLQKTAQIIFNQYDGIIPTDPNVLETFPGIGFNTARSIVVFSYNIPHVFIETNIRRVFIYEWSEILKKSIPKTNMQPNRKQNLDTSQKLFHDKELFPLIEQTLDQDNPREWYYALMDYGSHLPKIVTNPNRHSTHYTKQSKFEGSLRQVRGYILRELTKNQKLLKDDLYQTSFQKDFIEKAIDQLTHEGFIVNDKKNLELKKD